LGPACPRDINVTLGNCILEATMSFRCRYYDNYWLRDIVYDVWNKDERVTWRAGPKPTSKDNMWNPEFFKYGKTYGDRIDMH